MEVAGVVLGALPLALYALDNYHRCLQMTKDYVRFEATIKLIRRHIFVQQEQLQITLRSIGLVDPTPLQLEEHVRQLYPEKCEAFIDIIRHMEYLLTKLIEKLDIDVQGKPRWTSEPPERTVWEWRRVRRSFGRSSRQKLIDDLQYWNEALKVCFEKSELPLETDTPSATLEAIQGKFDKRSCAAIREDACQMHDAMRRSWICQSHDHLGNLGLAWHIDGSPKPGKFNILLSSAQSAPQRSPEAWQHFLFEMENKSKEAMTFASMNSTVPTTSLTADEARRPRKRFKSWLQSITDLEAASQPRSEDVEMIDARSRTPSPFVDPGLLELPPEVHCLCTFMHEAKRLGRLRVETREGHANEYLRVERQQTTDRPLKAIPLSSILSPGVGSSALASGSFLMSRKDRYAIAAAAAWAVLYLGDSPWISPDWEGKDTLYMILDDHVMVTRHYPSIAFSFKRGNTKAESDPAYSPHSSNLRSSLIRNKTIFALGILLIELCLNKPFDQLRKEVVTDSLTAAFGIEPAPDDYEVANLQMQKVYLEGGDFYGYAVQRCLRCEFPGRDITKNFAFDQFRRDFFAYVVAPIQATYTLLPSSCYSI